VALGAAVSYCRWSSDNWRCDLYCYEDVSGGFTTHVAGNRIVGEIPKVDFQAWRERRITDEQYTEQHRAQMAFLDSCKREPIGLPADGCSYNDPDLETFLIRVEGLRAMGYNVPDYVIEAIKEEMQEQSNPPPQERQAL
jgi:hypothetical protein